MFSLQEKMMSIITFPHPFPFCDVLLSSKESPATLSCGVLWYMIAYGKAFLQVTFKGFAGPIFKGLVGDFVVIVAFLSSGEEWVLSNICDSGVNMVR